MPLRRPRLHFVVSRAMAVKIVIKLSGIAYNRCAPCSVRALNEQSGYDDMPEKEPLFQPHIILIAACLIIVFALFIW